MKKNVLDYFLLLTVWAGLLSIFVGWIILIYPYKVIKILEPVKVHTPIYAGEMMYYELHMYKYHPLPCRVTRQLVNDHVITMTPITSNMPTGEYKKIVALRIPENAVEGDYVLCTTYEYDVNFMRTITYKFISPSFHIYKERKKL